MWDEKCPECGNTLSCLAGCSAHHSNWYCDGMDCGWTGWDKCTPDGQKMTVYDVIVDPYIHDYQKHGGMDHEEMVNSLSNVELLEQISDAIDKVIYYHVHQQ